MKISTTLSFVPLLALLLGTPIAMVGCASKGPVEKAGENVDKAVGDVKDAAEEITEEVKDEIDDATTN